MNLDLSFVFVLGLQLILLWFISYTQFFISNLASLIGFLTENPSRFQNQISFLRIDSPNQNHLIEIVKGNNLIIFFGY